MFNVLSGTLALDLDPTTIDFMSIPKGYDELSGFIATNTGTAPLNLTICSATKGGGDMDDEPTDVIAVEGVGRKFTDFMCWKAIARVYVQA